MKEETTPLTPERAADPNIKGKHAHNEAENKLSIYLARGRITEEQYQAGQAFYRAWFHGAEHIRDQSIFDRLLEEGRRPPPLDHQIDAAMIWSKMAAMLNAKDRRIFLVMLRVCCYDEWVNQTEVGSKNNRMQWLIDGLDIIWGWRRLANELFYDYVYKAL